jgi:protein-S-isoprenylcysteine O-methyltransferase Ste14
MEDTALRPNIIPWPPIIYAGCALVALGLNYVHPLAWPTDHWKLVLMLTGLVLLVVAVTIEVSAVRAFRRHKTTIQPHRGASALITDGPFGFSRNPIYLGNTFLVFGAGLLFGIAWLLPAAFIGAALTQKLAIEREERHLAAGFGKAWEEYVAATPRWLGQPRHWTSFFR